MSTLSYRALSKLEHQRVITFFQGEKDFIFATDTFTPFWQVVPASLVRGVWAVESEGQMVGVAGYLQATRAGDAWLVGLLVWPEQRRRGVGTAVWAWLRSSLRRRGARQLFCAVAPEQHAGKQFLMRHGFAPYASSHTYRLDTRRAAREDHAVIAQQLATQGLQLRSLDRFPRRGLAERLLPLWNRTRPDQPDLWPFEPYNAQRLEQEMLASAELALDGSHALLDTHNHLVALTLNAWLDAAHLTTAYLGVDPAWRGRGIASLLKRCLVAYAQQRSVPFLVAENDARNTAMRSVNTRLGFEPVAELITYRGNNQ